MQIIFESLPVSSSGNVMLWIPVLQNLLHLAFPENNIPDFDFLLHIPTIFVIGVFFFRSWCWSIINIQKGFWSIMSLIICCVLADTITVFFYYLWKAVGTDFFPLWFGFLCTTFLLFSLRWVSQKTFKERLSFSDALILGVAQGCALLPGVSRLATTFVTAVWLGYGPERSFRYSFLLQMPLLGAACVQALWHLRHLETYGVLTEPKFYGVVFTATGISFCVLSIVFVMVKQKIVWWFAWYTAFLSMVALFFSK